jgi:hypothetical protein
MATYPVIARPDRAIQDLAQASLDAPVKPGHDGVEGHP